MTLELLYQLVVDILKANPTPAWIMEYGVWRMSVRTRTMTDDPGIVVYHAFDSQMPGAHIPFDSLLGKAIGQVIAGVK